MDATKRRIKALQKQSGGPLPILILSYEGRYGTEGDGLYHGPNGAKYTPEQVEELSNTNTVITIAWESQWGKSADIEMSWD